MHITLLILGICFLMWGIFQRIAHSVRRRSCTGRVLGKVTGIHEKVDERTDDDGSTKTTITYHPEVRYTVDGNSFSKTTEHGHTSLKFAVGDTVTIEYHPNNPEQFYIQGDLSSESHGNGFIFAGVVLFIVAIGYALFSGEG